ncbi:uncharacterized protein LOC141704047 [Apium graveolens]|uniref:uncharacterized protein LOC141704047 n=1 Tax=Apium graveolens TaxID=4045 RepID=UPI003D78C234
MATGITDHMTADYGLLHNVKNAKPHVTVNLPTRATTMVTHLGDVKLASGLKLLNIPYVPVFTLSENTSQLSFVASKATLADEYTLWHNRLGHATVSKLKFIECIKQCIHGVARVTWLYLLQHKSDYLKTMETFYHFVQRQFASSIKVIRSDNAKEFDDTKCRRFFQMQGIVHQTFCAYRSQQNARGGFSALSVFDGSMFGILCSSLYIILSQDPLPTLDRAFQLVVQEDRVRHAKSDPEVQPPDVMCFPLRTNAARGKATDSDERYLKEHKSHLYCTYCKKTGHLEKSYSEIIGYLEWWPKIKSKHRGCRKVTSNKWPRTRIYTSQFHCGQRWVVGQALREAPLKHSRPINGKLLRDLLDHSRMLIGTNIMWDGLYYFDGEASVQHLTTHGSSSILELWHRRMGHPLKKKTPYEFLFGTSTIYNTIRTFVVFAPVAKMVIVRAFLAIAASKNWEIHQIDIHNAFLQGDLDEEVHIKLPPDFESSSPNKVCRLRKSLYGLKEAPQCWFPKLVSALKKYGFLQSYSDYSMFTYTKGDIQINVLVYVDDLIISRNDFAALRALKAYLSDCFHMKDPGLLGAKPAHCPIEQNHKLGLENGKLLSDPASYRRLVGRLIYLIVTCSDLAYSVHILSQFMQEPRTEHGEAALRVVPYLKGTSCQGILLRADSELTLQGWYDSDWAACPITRRSLTGWMVFLGNSPVSWKTEKQNIISRCSAEAEYHSMDATTCELKWLKGLLLSLGVHHPKAIKLFCDSQSVHHIAKNPSFHERTKHIEVDCYFVRDAISDGLIDPSYVHTNTQLADVFTKALGKSQFEFLIRKLGVFTPTSPA